MLSDVSTVSSDLADLPTPATPEPPSPSIDDVSAGEEASYYPLVFLSSAPGAEEEDLVPAEHAAAHP